MRNLRKQLITWDPAKLDYKKLAIGYDAGTLHKIKETTPDQKQLYLQAGFLKPDKFGRENSYYTRFNGCIVFPLLDNQRTLQAYMAGILKTGHHYLEGDHMGTLSWLSGSGNKQTDFNRGHYRCSDLTAAAGDH